MPTGCTNTLTQHQWLVKKNGHNKGVCVWTLCIVLYYPRLAVIRSMGLWWLRTWTLNIDTSMKPFPVSTSRYNFLLLHVYRVLVYFQVFQFSRVSYLFALAFLPLPYYVNERGAISKDVWLRPVFDTYFYSPNSLSITNYLLCGRFEPRMNFCGASGVNQSS